VLEVSGTIGPIDPTIPLMAARVERRETHRAGDFVLVFLGWVAIVVCSAVLPVDDLGLGRAALFVHLICVPLGFGAVVMMNVYMVLWLLGRHSLRDVVALTSVAHQLLAAGLAGLIASGIALDPDLGNPSMRVKLVLLLVLMLNAARARHLLDRLEVLAPAMAGHARPRSVTRRVAGSAVISQVAWWGTIVIGFVTTTSR
jgi:hypothetical protein